MLQDALQLAREMEATQTKGNAMHKLLAAFAENYHAKPRVALLRYLARHPMAECMAMPADAELIALARQHAREDAEYLGA
jgi:hypothetical protein